MKKFTKHIWSTKMKLTNVQEAILISILLSYNQISIENSEATDKELLWLMERIQKAGNQIMKKPLLTKKPDIVLAEKLFNNIKRIDADFFAEKDFSSLIMSILTLNYLIMHHNNSTLRVKLGDIDTMKYITMLEQVKEYKNVLYYHMDAIDELLKGIGIVHQPNEK